MGLWETMGLGHDGNGTRWVWDTMELGHDRIGTRWDWDTMGLGQNGTMGNDGTGARWDCNGHKLLSSDRRGQNNGRDSYACG